MGVPCSQAEGEAEAYCAYLNEMNVRLFSFLIFCIEIMAKYVALPFLF